MKNQKHRKSKSKHERNQTKGKEKHNKVSRPLQNATLTENRMQLEFQTIIFPFCYTPHHYQLTHCAPAPLTLEILCKMQPLQQTESS